MQKSEREYPSRPLVAVGAVIVSESRVLLVKRNSEPARGLWAIPGGLVELGEAVENAVRREVKEETGIDIRVERLLDVVDSIVRDEVGKIRFHYVVVDFLAKPVTTVVAPKSDAAEVRWVSLNDLSRYPVTKSTAEFLERVRTTNS